MKYFFFILALYYLPAFGQNNDIDLFKCAFDENSNSKNQDIFETIVTGSDCGRTSIWWTDYPDAQAPWLPSIYEPQNEYDYIYIRLNIIILQKDDGTGNFESNNREHLLFLSDVFETANWRLRNMDLPADSPLDCAPISITDAKFQFVPNIMYIRNSKFWDTLNSNQLGGSLGSWYPDHVDFYLKELDNQINANPNIPKGINIYFSQESKVYNEYVLNNNFLPSECNRCNNLALDNTDCLGYDMAYCNTLHCSGVSPVTSSMYVYAASQQPDFNNLQRTSRIHYPNVYNKYIQKKNLVADNPNFFCGTPRNWETVRSWAVWETSQTIVHEVGHSLNLGHVFNCKCLPNIMTGGTAGCRTTFNYFNSEQLARAYRSLSLSNTRQFVTEDSHNGNCIQINDSQKWDVDMRIYSDVVIERSGELKLTCKLIMPPNSKIIVRRGGKLIIEGGEILSADNTSWDGIRNEQTGFTLINPNTEFIASQGFDYFITYSNTTYLPCESKNNKSENINFDYNVNDLSNNTIVSKEIEIFPNPTKNLVFYKLNNKNLIGSNVLIYNSSNIKILQSEINKETGAFDISKFSNGIYYLNIIVPTGQKISYKIIKE